jgi:hypothetical protein
MLLNRFKRLGHEIEGKKIAKWTDLGLNKGGERFLKFSEVPPFLYIKNIQ